MIDENQIVRVRWNNTNQEWYTGRGYIFTKRNDFFDVKAIDLSPKSSAKIEAICDYCGSAYITQYAMITSGRRIVSKDCCAKCTGKKTSEVSLRNRAKKNFDRLEAVCDEFGYVLLTHIDDYTDVKMDVEFLCLKHGKQKMSLDNLKHGHECRMCAYEKVGDALRHDVNFVQETINSTNNNTLLNPDDYRGMTIRNLQIRCACGNIYKTSFANFKRAGVRQCYSCSCKESVAERIIREYLDSNQIDYIQEKRFADCKDKKPLPFDFYLPDCNLIIEFDGQHHYVNNVFNNCEITKKHDQIKNDYCESKNIDLLRIPYWQGSQIENILDEKLKFVGKRYSLVS